MGILNRFFGNGVSQAVGVGVGGSAGSVLEPAVQDLRNFAWNKHQTLPLEAFALAQGVAQGQVASDWAHDEATLTGINKDRFDKLVDIFNTGPGVGEAFTLLRRGFISPDRFKAALKRNAIEDEWITAMIKAVDVLLSPAEVAAGVQQGHLPNPKILPDVSAAVPAVGGQVTAESPDGAKASSVPLTQISIDPIDEAKGSGVDLDRLKVIANLAGLPPGSAELLTMWNRELIDEESVDAGLREGHLKTKWSQAYKRMRWNVLGAAEYAGLHLRGWITQDEMYKGGKLTGHTKDQMDKMYLNRGRPLAPVQAFTAWARGAPHPKGLGYTDRAGTFDEQDFLKALQQSDVRTEYGPILWHNRYAYPTLFQLGRLATAGAITPERTREILKFERYEKQEIDALVGFWTKDVAAKADSHVTSEQNRLRTTTHSSYLSGEISKTVARNSLTVAGVASASLDAIMRIWDTEKNLIRAQLTAANVKKAFNKGGKNNATGQKWTRDEALAALIELGWAALAANDYLDIP